MGLQLPGRQRTRQETLLPLRRQGVQGPAPLSVFRFFFNRTLLVLSFFQEKLLLNRLRLQSDRTTTRDQLPVFFYTPFWFWTGPVQPKNLVLEIGLKPNEMTLKSDASVGCE